MMFKEGLVTLVAIITVLLMRRDIRKKTERAWIVSTSKMVSFLILCMLVGIFASIFIMQALILYSSVSEQILNQELFFSGTLTVLLCLTSYRISYHPIFREWRQILRKTVLDDRIKKLEENVRELDSEITKLEEIPFEELTAEEKDKIMTWAFLDERLRRAKKNRRNLFVTKVASYSSVVLSVIVQLVIEAVMLVRG